MHQSRDGCSRPKINTFLRKFHPKKKSMGESINISSAFGEEENNFKKNWTILKYDIMISVRMHWIETI